MYTNIFQRRELYIPRIIVLSVDVIGLFIPMLFTVEGI